MDGHAGGPSDGLDVIESSDGRTASSVLRRESCEGRGGGTLSVAPCWERGSVFAVFAVFEWISLLRGGAGGGLAGADMSRELLEAELLLELASFFGFGASCNLNSSLCCVFVPEAFLSSAALSG